MFQSQVTEKFGAGRDGLGGGWQPYGTALDFHVLKEASYIQSKGSQYSENLGGQRVCRP
jgi:hypothetical protein